MFFEHEYKIALLEQAKLGDKQAITELASDASTFMIFEVFPLIKHVDLEIIKDAILAIDDKDRRDNLLELDFSLEQKARIEQAEQNSLRESSEYQAILAFLKDQTWYRGLRTLNPSDPSRNPNTDYIVTITNCAIQAATYADDGVIATLKLNDDFNFNMHKPRSSSRFSPIIFDEESKSTDLYTGIVVNGVTDISGKDVETRGFAEKEVLDKVWRNAINIGLHHSNQCLEVVDVEPAIDVVTRFIENKLKLVNSGQEASNTIPDFISKPHSTIKSKLNFR